ncbi:phage major capsid protein [Duganella sp. BJB476]|uniref:phage major capsid protein n=1 Tax=Duganella sp. BJB476 TaxID=1871176 RepID=UPI000E34A908|nr:phage major capsid protein [Duganella sp. BJB476]RFP32424.1 phage major capsid protein [Duganella sp. BJB476]
MTIRILQQKKAAAVAKAKGINDVAAAADRDLNADEQAAYDAAMSEASGYDARIARAQELAAADVSDGVQIADNARISVTDNASSDPKAGFKSAGEFFKAVRGAALAASTGQAVDRRLLIGAAAPTTFGNEGTGADGGFLIPAEFSKEIWRLSLGEGSLIPMTANTEVSGNSMVFPKDETTPWGGAGVQAYWKGEATAGNQSKMALGTEMLRLKELMVLIPVTNELMDDAPALGSYLSPLASDHIMWKANESILFGTGGGQPYGCMNSNSLVVVAKETGQGTGTLLQPNISKMRSRLKTGELKNAIWIGNPDILPALEGMTIGNLPIFLPPGTGLREAYDGTLNGRPVILSEHAAAFSAQSDLSLIALSGYRTITKAGGIQTDTSMHLFFDANATAFRFIFRMDGQPIMGAPITPPTGKSTNTRSYFVTLGAR